MAASSAEDGGRFGTLVRAAIVGALSLSCALGVSAVRPCAARAEELSPQVEAARGVIADKAAATHVSIPAGEYSWYTVRPDRWYTSDPLRWSSAFLPGNLWFEYQRTGDTWWRDAALARQAPLERNKAITTNHDIGFLLLGSYRNGYRSTGDPRFRAALLQGAESLSTRYDPTVGMVQTKNSTKDFMVYNDTMMNIELLYWGAGNGGDPAWTDQATSHALRAMKDFTRADGSTYHYVSYDRSTGAVTDKGQGQGYVDGSTWSRGQAWTIYGLSTAYRITRDARLLEGAHRASDYWRSHVPTDGVPYWDFDAPDIPNEPRDSSAAAIVASAFVELGRLDPDPARRAEYLDMARETLEVLSSSAYLSDDPSDAAALQHGTYAKMLGSYDSGLSWGEYYFAEAIERLRTQVTRWAGPNRYDTALRVADLSFASADTVVLASGMDFADALSASTLAGLYDAPVLLTSPARLSGGVARAIENLGAKRVVIVGGPVAVSSAVESQVSRLPGVRVERVSGRDRYEVSANVARIVIDEEGPGFCGRVFLARGDDYADALAISPVAYSSGAPVLLTRSAELSASASRILREPSVRDVTVVGGASAVSADTVRAATRLTSASFERIAGADRYETAGVTARWAVSRDLAQNDCVGVATGETFPDGLSGGAAVGARRGVLLLARSTALPPATAAALRQIAGPATDVLVLGGDLRVSEHVEERLRQVLPER